MNICSPPICVEKGEQNILSQLPIFCTLQRKIGDYSRRQDILIVTIANKPHLGLAALPDIQINFCSFLIFPETWAVLRGWSRGRKWEHKWARNVNKLSSEEKSKEEWRKSVRIVKIDWVARCWAECQFSPTFPFKINRFIFFTSLFVMAFKSVTGGSI